LFFSISEKVVKLVCLFCKILELRERERERERERKGEKRKEIDEKFNKNVLPLFHIGPQPHNFLQLLLML
jgi:hypothetical protein